MFLPFLSFCLCFFVYHVWLEIKTRDVFPASLVISCVRLNDSLMYLFDLGTSAPFCMYTLTDNELFILGQSCFFFLFFLGTVYIVYNKSLKAHFVCMTEEVSA